MRNQLLTHRFDKYNTLIIILIGLAGSILNYVSNFLFTKVFHFPLYMDTIFTVACSFFSLWSGLIAAVCFHLLAALLENNIFGLTYSICSVSIVLIVRFIVRSSKESGIGIFQLLSLSLALTILIAIEGGICYFFLYGNPEFVEDSEVNIFTGSLFIHNVPLVISAILGRLPISFIDKTIASFAGFFISSGTDTLIRKIKRNS